MSELLGKTLLNGNFGRPLSPKQSDFLYSKARLVIFRAGIRSGKTWILCLKALQYAKNLKRFCIVSFSYPILRDVCIHTMKRILDEFKYPYIENISDKIITVDNQEILFRSGDAPDTLRGLSLDGFGIDEAREFKTREIYDIMIGRLSNSKDAQAFITSSPKGRNWVNELETSKIRGGVFSIVQKTEENPFIPEEYIQSLREQYTSDFAKQELDAEIVEFGAGIISGAWFKEINYYVPTRGVRFWDIAVSIKTSADFSAGVLCSSNNGRFVIHHISHGKLSYPELRKRIVEHAKLDGPEIVIAVEEAGQQRGFIDDLAQLPELRGYVIRAVRPHGDKLNRAIRWASRAQLGQVDVCSGSWIRGFKDECNSFTADDTHEHDDMIDAVSGAYQYIFEEKRVWDSFSMDMCVKMTIDYTNQKEYNKQYISFFQNESGELYCLSGIFNTVLGVFYILWAKKYTDIVPDIILSDLIKSSKINIIKTDFLCNEFMVNDGRSVSKLIVDIFKRANIIGGLRFPVNYDLNGSIVYGRSMFNNKLIFVDRDLIDVVSHFSGWIYENEKVGFGYEYCLCLCLILSELRKSMENAPKPKKILDYQPKQFEKKEEVVSWQVA